MNRRVLLYVVVALWAALGYSCKNSNSPQAVTDKFLKSLASTDYETAKSVSTKNTWGLLDIWASFSQEVPEELRQKRMEQFKVKIIETKKESDTTMVVSYVTEPNMLPFNQIRLLQEKDLEGNIKWKVDISTLDLVGGEEMYIEEEKMAVEDEGSEPLADTMPNKKADSARMKKRR